MASKISDKNNIKFGIILSYLSLIASVLGTFFVTRKVLDYIGDYQYGLYSFVLSIINWTTIVSNALSTSYIRFATIEATKHNGDTSTVNSLYFKLLFFISLGILIIGCIFFWVLFVNKVCLFAYEWNDSVTLYILFFISIINIFFTISTSLFSLYVNYKKKFVFSRLLTLLISILGFVGHWLLALYTKSIISIAIYTIVATLLTAIGNYLFAKFGIGFRFRKTKIKDNSILIRQIVVFSGIILFNTAVDQINASVDQIILGSMGAAESVTVYKLGQSLTSYLVVMSTSISSSYVPTINEMVIKEKNEELNNLYLKISRMQAIVLCAVAFGFLTCGFDFISLWLGEQRIDAYYVGVGLMLLNLCPLTINSSIEIQRARNKHLFRALVYFFVALFNVILSILLLFLFPKEKAIFACLLGTIISTVISHWIIMNIYNYKAMGLPVIRQMTTLGLHGLVGLFSYCVVYLFMMIPSLKTIDNHVYLFLLRGFLFVVLYLIGVLIIDWKIIRQRLFKNRQSSKGIENENQASD